MFLLCSNELSVKKNERTFHLILYISINFIPHYVYIFLFMWIDRPVVEMLSDFYIENLYLNETKIKISSYLFSIYLIHITIVADITKCATHTTKKL